MDIRRGSLFIRTGPQQFVVIGEVLQVEISRVQERVELPDGRILENTSTEPPVTTISLEHGYRLRCRDASFTDESPEYWRITVDLQDVLSPAGFLLSDYLSPASGFGATADAVVAFCQAVREMGISSADAVAALRRAGASVPRPPEEEEEEEAEYEYVDDTRPASTTLPETHTPVRRKIRVRR